MRLLLQHRGAAAREHAVGAAQRRQPLQQAVAGRAGVEMVAPTSTKAGGEHRATLLGETLLGAVIDHRDARQGHDGQQGLGQAGRRAAGQEAVDVMVVDEAGHQLRRAVHPHHAADAVAQHRRGCAARQHVAQAAVERKVQHAIQPGLACRAAHIGLDLARAAVGPGLVDGKALAEGKYRRPAQLGRQALQAGRGRVSGVQQVGEVVGRHVEGGVHPEGIHPHLAQPVAVALAQRAAHHGVLGVQVVQAAHLASQHLLALAEVADIRRPVVDRCGTVGGLARVVLIEGGLARRGLRARAGVGQVAGLWPAGRRAGS